MELEKLPTWTIHALSPEEKIEHRFWFTRQNVCFGFLKKRLEALERLLR